jgi:hypothetical protein
MLEDECKKSCSGIILPLEMDSSFPICKHMGYHKSPGGRGKIGPTKTAPRASGRPRPSNSRARRSSGPDRRVRTSESLGPKPLRTASVSPVSHAEILAAYPSGFVVCWTRKSEYRDGILALDVFFSRQKVPQRISPSDYMPSKSSILL